LSNAFGRGISRRTRAETRQAIHKLCTDFVDNYGLPFRGGQKAANLKMAHFPHSRAQYQDLSHAA